MSRANHHGKRHGPMKAAKRKKDIKRLGRALIELAEAELEKEAECEHRKQSPKKNKGSES